MPPPERVQIHSTKFDGSLHYRFDAELVSRTPGEWRVYSRPGEVHESYRGRLVSRSHALRVFWPDRDWNLLVRWRPDWSLEDFYVNIATPAKFIGDRCEWIDLDLDLILRPGFPEPLLDDADEFDTHSARFGYGPSLVNRCWQTVEHVRAAMRGREDIFAHSTELWRPPGVDA